MLSRIIFSKKGETAIIDVFLDRATYERFKSYTVKNQLDESSALISILKRGMANYWLEEFKQMKESHTHIKKLFEEYKKDNEILKALQKENEQLKKILGEKNCRYMET